MGDLEGLQILQQGFSDLGKGMQVYGEQKNLAKGAAALQQEDAGNFYGGEEGRTAAAMAFRTGNTNAGVTYQNQDNMEMRMTKLADSIATEMTKPEGERDVNKINKLQKAFTTMGQFYQNMNMYRDYSKLVAASMRGKKKGKGTGEEGTTTEGNNVPGVKPEDRVKGNLQLKEVADKSYIYADLEEYPEAPGTMTGIKEWVTGKQGTAEIEYAAKVAKVDANNKKKIAERMNEVMQYYPPESRYLAELNLINEYDANKKNMKNYVNTLKEKKNTALKVPVPTMTTKTAKTFTKDSYVPLSSGGNSPEALKQVQETKNQESGDYKQTLSPYALEKKETKNTQPVQEPQKLNPKEVDEAKKWLKSNPKHPQAAAVKEKLKQSGVIVK